MFDGGHGHGVAGQGASLIYRPCPGVDKLIIHEKTGLMADFGKVEDLKKCWERLLFDGKFSANISQNGRKHIIESFSAKRMAEEYMNLYQEMVKVG